MADEGNYFPTAAIRYSLFTIPYSLFVNTSFCVFPG